jgi:serine/threonine-protein kinase
LVSENESSDLDSLLAQTNSIYDPSATGALPSLTPESSDTGFAVDNVPSDAYDDSFDVQLADATPNLPNRSASPAESNEPERPHGESDRFDKLESHAKGGLGVVFVARDKQLDRHVAVKEIRSRFTNVKEARERFEFEARVTGGLEHPCVVPVYAFGEHPDGAPYYAMRFISGRSLKEAINQFYGLNKKSERIKSLDEVPDLPSADRTAKKTVSLRGAEFRNLLSRLVATCNGIAFAHSRGILHRDIKPANIMLGKYGETLVVDWGLAKYVGTPEDASMTSHLHTGISGSSPTATMAGTTIGTPLFMSPEQADGKLDELTPASDIYSLGTTLFLIITGSYPYQGSTPKEVVAQVKTGNYIPPRQLRADIPRPLAAICEKAMSRTPADRYSTALEMADDLERYLAGDPVRAYPEPWYTRVSRWIRNHQAITAAAAALLLTTAIGTTIGMGLIGAEQQKTQQALQNLTVEKAKTDQALQDKVRAFAVTESSLTLLTDEIVGQMLARNPQLDATDRKLLTRMLREFEKFTEGESSTPSAVALRATGFQRVGDLQRRLGEIDQASQSYASAGQLVEQLLNRFPDSQEYRLAKATLDGDTGLLEAAGGHYRNSIKDYSSAIGILQGLAKQAKLDDGSSLKLAKLIDNRANNFARVGELESALSDLVAAFEILSDPNFRFHPNWMRASAHNRSSLGSFLSNKMQNNAKAIDAYRVAIETYDRLASELTDDVEIQFERASAKMNLGVVLTQQKDSVAAEASLRDAFQAAKTLSETYPGFEKFRRLYAETSTRLASVIAETKPEVAGDMLSNAKALLTDLSNNQPNDAAIKRDLARTLGALAKMRAANNAPDATDLFEQQLSQWEQLMRLEPDEPKWESGRLGAENNYANFLKKTKRYPEAIEHFGEILKFLETQQNPNPELLWRSLYGIAGCHDQQKDYEAALPYWQRLSKNKNHRHWSAFESQRIIALLRTGELTKGLAAAKKRLADNPTPKPIDHYDLACCYAIALEVAQDRPQAFAESQSVSSLSKTAMALLEQAAVGGFFKEKKHQNLAAVDADLNALRQVESFKEFCKRHSIQKASDF